MVGLILDCQCVRRGGNAQDVDDGVPFPFDHFFFCFLPPVAAGACSLLIQCSRRGGLNGTTYHDERLGCRGWKMREESNLMVSCEVFSAARPQFRMWE